MNTPTKYYFQIKTTSGVPIYRQIVDQVNTHIVTGKMKADDFLPSVRQVASELEINPMTVSKAYSLLEKDGVLEYVRGQGMKVLGGGKESKKDLKGREEDLMPILREVVNKAQQLSLEPGRVINKFKSMWEETQNE